MNDTTDRLTLAQFIAQYKVRMRAERIASNPNMADMGVGARHWRCVLRCGRHQMTVPFSQGSAHTAAPTVADVLNCLASDSAGLENAQGFEDWCADYGYDTDSRKAERTYHVVERTSAQLMTLLGADAYDALLWRTERE